jgi:hypothetical protein
MIKITRFLDHIIIMKCPDLQKAGPYWLPSPQILMQMSVYHEHIGEQQEVTAITVKTETESLPEFFLGRIRTRCCKIKVWPKNRIKIPPLFRRITTPDQTGDDSRRVDGCAAARHSALRDRGCSAIPFISKFVDERPALPVEEKMWQASVVQK